MDIIPASLRAEPLEIAVPYRHVGKATVVRHHVGTLWCHIGHCLPGLPGWRLIFRAAPGIVPVGLET